MQLSMILALASVVGAGFWHDVSNKNRVCDSPENCVEKCENGTYHEKFSKKLNMTRLRCDGRHADYKYIIMGCRQEMGGEGIHVNRSIKSCAAAGGMFCGEGRKAGTARSTHLKCVMEPCNEEVFSKDCRKENYDIVPFVALKDVAWNCKPDYLDHHGAIGEEEEV